MKKSFITSGPGLIEWQCTFYAIINDRKYKYIYIHQDETYSLIKYALMS